MRRTLASLAAQTTDAPIEVLLMVDEHLRDDAVQCAKALPSLLSRVLTWPEHFSIGRARNTAVANAGGEILLFLPDYIEPAPGALQAHLDYHDCTAMDACAAVSTVRFEPEIPERVLCRALAAAGFLPPLEGVGPSVRGIEFLTSPVLSLRKSAFLGKTRLAFAEDLDTEWAVDRELYFQLQRAGYRVPLLPNAQCSFREPISFADFSSLHSAITYDLYVLAERMPECAALCSTMKAFRLELLPYWESSVARDTAVVEELVRQIEAVENDLAQFHTHRYAAHSQRLIARVAECLLLYAEHARQYDLICLARAAQEERALQRSIDVEHTEGEQRASEQTPNTGPTEKKVPLQ
ncbi:MAG: glycosyltransferase [Bdellovibrionales bacterium]|nr:glycosyltransferase [Bdellovibrionales bacterium]